MNDESKVHHPPVVPREYAGKWIAWDRNQTRIVASAATLREARQMAIEAGESDPLLDRVPEVDVRFVGGSSA